MHVFAKLVQADVTTTVALIVKAGVAVRKGADTHILASHAHAVTLINQRGVCHHFSVPPVNGHRTRRHLLPVINNALHLSVQHKAIGCFRQLRRQFHKALAIERRVDVIEQLAFEVRPPINKQLCIRFVHERQCRCATVVENFPVAVDKLLIVGFGNNTLCQ